MEVKIMFTIEELKKAFIAGLNLGYEEGSNYGTPDDDKSFDEFLKLNYPHLWK